MNRLESALRLPLGRRELLATATAAAFAAPAAAQKMIDLDLPGGPSDRPLSSAFPGKGEMIRLYATGAEPAEINKICAALKAKKVYCALNP